MERKYKKGVLIAAVCFVLLCIAGAFILIVKQKESKTENGGIMDLKVPEDPFVYPSFCARITKIDETDTMEVEALELNTRNYQGPFWVRISDAKFVWCSEWFQKEDLKEGDIVFIQFGGSVMESYPKKIKAQLVYYLGDKESFSKIGAEGGEE